jgi:deazaflavin-dependent oxidoreductase (nitroreductase family)
MIFNPLMLWLLRSPLHPLVSGSLMAITYTGRKSGKTFTVPVNYLGSGGDLLTVSFAKRKWWRNLRGGAPVTLHLRGKDLPAHAESFDDFTVVSQGLAEIVRANPKYARFLKVKLDERGQPSMVDLDLAARERVFIRTKLI